MEEQSGIEVLALPCELRCRTPLKKIAGLPQIDAITIIDAQVKPLNFSRYWPMAEVNVSDRDYFASRKDFPKFGEGGWLAAEHEFR